MAKNRRGGRGRGGRGRPAQEPRMTSQMVAEKQQAARGGGEPAPQAEGADETTQYQKFVLGTLDKMMKPEVIESLVSNAKANGVETAVGRAASFITINAFEKADDDLPEEMVIPAAIEIGLYLNGILAEAGASEESDAMQVKVTQAVIAAVFSDADIDPGQEDMKSILAEATQGFDMQSIFPMLEQINAEAPQGQQQPGQPPQQGQPQPHVMEA